MRRRERDVAILKKRLDRYNDNWRALPVILPNPKRKIQRKRGPKPKIKEITDPNTVPVPIPEANKTAPTEISGVVIGGGTLTTTTATMTTTTGTKIKATETPKKPRKPRAKRTDSQKDGHASKPRKPRKPKIIKSEPPPPPQPVTYLDVRDIRLTAEQVHQMRLLQSPNPMYQNVYPQI